MYTEILSCFELVKLRGSSCYQVTLLAENHFSPLNVYLHVPASKMHLDYLMTFFDVLFEVRFNYFTRKLKIIG